MVVTFSYRNAPRERLDTVGFASAESTFIVSFWRCERLVVYICHTWQNVMCMAQTLTALSCAISRTDPSVRLMIALTSSSSQHWTILLSSNMLSNRHRKRSSGTPWQGRQRIPSCLSEPGT